MDLSFPIGRFNIRDVVDPRTVPALIGDIEAAPGLLRAAVHGLDDAQLDTPYRPGGWTVRQTVHHVGDSHMNSFIRFRKALTENEPTIFAYDQDRWSELADMRTVPVEVSLQLVDALHRRWTVMLKSLAPADFDRTFRHPEMGLVRLDNNLALYAWHGKHHTAHITALRHRMGW